MNTCYFISDRICKAQEEWGAEPVSLEIANFRVSHCNACALMAIYGELKGINKQQGRLNEISRTLDSQLPKLRPK
jgi:hypothetical protein